MKTRKPYTLYARRDASKEGAFYVRFYDDSGRRVARSSGQTTKTAVETWVANQLAKKKLAKMTADPTLTEFACNWWTWIGAIMSVVGEPADRSLEPNSVATT